MMLNVVHPGASVERGLTPDVDSGSQHPEAGAELKGAWILELQQIQVLMT